MTLMKNTSMQINKIRQQSKLSFSGDRYSDKQINNNSTESTVSTQVIFKVAQWFLNKMPMSENKLQKLCYYAYAWYIVFFNDADVINNEEDIKTLCDDYFEAWIHGPVCRRLYNKYRQYGGENIPAEAEKPIFDDKTTDLLNQVWNIYGSLTADQLEHLTHQEDPWKMAREGVPFGDACTNRITPLSIFNYYFTK